MTDQEAIKYLHVLLRYCLSSGPDSRLVTDMTYTNVIIAINNYFNMLLNA